MPKNIKKILNFTHPTCLRSIGLARKYINGKDGVAFFLGVGVDNQLAIDSNSPPPDDWGQLLMKLNSRNSFKNDANKERFKDLTANFPTEVASIFRWQMGDNKFNNEIEKLTPDFPIQLKQIFTQKFCQLILKSNLIVTTNYSKNIYNALTTYIKKTKSNKKIVTLSRENLSSFKFPIDNSNHNKAGQPDIVYFIYLHGRCNNGSYPILDAWGYNIAQNDDEFYTEFLTNLFLNKHVITIGTSWKDIPLRNSAALVVRKRPYIKQCHIAFYRDPKMLNDENGADRAFSNTMRAAYGVDFIDVSDNDKSIDLLNILNTKLPIPSTSLNNLNKLADFLDETGDYESALQSNYLSKMNSNLRISTSVNNIYDKLLSNKELSQVKNWVIVARIEKHLRHHAYLYMKNNNKRQHLWTKLLKHLPSKSEWETIDARIRFDFIIGKWEIIKTSKFKLSSDYKILPTPFKDRLSIVCKYNIWMDPNKRLIKNNNNLKVTKVEFETITDELLDKGWESMAAKVQLDKTSLLAQHVRKNDNLKNRQEIINEATLAESIARLSGCYRRRIKADILNVIWNPTKAGQNLLLGRLRANDTSQSLEPGLLDALGLGLLVCHLNNGKSDSLNIKDATDLFQEFGLDNNHLKGALGRYWEDMIPKEVDNYLKNLRKHFA